MSKSSLRGSQSSSLSSYVSAKPARWITQQMVEEENREMLLKVTLREMIFYAIFVILVNIFAVTMMFPSMYHFARVVQELFLEKRFQTLNNFEITFSDIKSVSDFWAYCETILLDGFHWEYWYQSAKINKKTQDDEKKILYENKLIGVPRLRQLKVRNDSCVIHEYFRGMFLACYDEFSMEAEDTEPFGLKNGTAWTFNTEEVTGSITYTGKVGSYHGGGYYRDLSLDRNKTSDIIADLKKNLWITRGTRAVFLDFTVYNANLNLFCIIKILFEFPPTGGVLPSYSFQAVKLIRSVTADDYFVLALELLIVVFVFFYTMEEVRVICYFRWSYIKQFWNCIDLMYIVLICFCLILRSIRSQHATATLNKYLYVTDKYANFDLVARIYVVSQLFIGLVFFMTYTKIFKYLSFTRTIGLLINTMRRCFLDIIVFSAMLYIIFFAYAAVGYLLFGTEVEGFSSLGASVFILLRITLGDFSYMEIERANRILAPIYYISYIFFIYILLIMFLAILSDAYSDAKTENSPDELQMSQYLKRGFYRFLDKCGFVRFIPAEKPKPNEYYGATIKEIRRALKKCGFNDLEIEMFFSRHNIDSAADVGEFDITYLVADLEGRPHATAKTSRTRKAGEWRRANGIPSVTFEDFLAQQKRLAEVGTTVTVLTKSVDDLLQKLNTLDTVRKRRKSR